MSTPCTALGRDHNKDLTVNMFLALSTICVVPTTFYLIILILFLTVR